MATISSPNVTIPTFVFSFSGFGRPLHVKPPPRSEVRILSPSELNRLLKEAGA